MDDADFKLQCQATSRRRKMEDRVISIRRRLAKLREDIASETIGTTIIRPADWSETTLFRQTSDPREGGLARIATDMLIDEGIRIRKARAWLRFGAVLAWFAVIVGSGSHRWPWALPWVIILFGAVAHAYRDEIGKFRAAGYVRARFPHAGHLVTAGFPGHSMNPRVNFIGACDVAGCLWGGLFVTSGLPFLDRFRAFQFDDASQGAAIGAGYVLVAVILLGGVAIVTKHISWESDDARVIKGSWFAKYEWHSLAIASVGVVAVSLYPGHYVPGSAWRIRSMLDAGATIAAAVTAWRGRIANRAVVETTYDRLFAVRNEARRIVSFDVHELKTGMAIVIALLDQNSPFVSAAALQLESEAALLEFTLRSSELTTIKGNAADHYASLLLVRTSRKAARHWTGVVADIRAESLRVYDSEFIKNILSVTMSNADRANARDFTVALEAFGTDRGLWLQLSATCSCGKHFDGTTLPKGHALASLRAGLQDAGGQLRIEEQGGGIHTLTVRWMSFSRPWAVASSNR